MTNRKKLMNMALIFLGGTFIISLILMVVINTRVQTKNFWDNQNDKLALIAEKYVSDIESWAIHQINILESIAQEVQAPNLASGDDYRGFLLRTIQRNAELQSAFLFLDDGRYYFDNDNVFLDDDDQFFEWYEVCKQTPGEIVFTEPYLDSFTNNLIVSCMRSVVMPDGMIGVVGTDISIERLIEKVDNLCPSPTGGSWLVSSNYKVLTYYIDASFLPQVIEKSGYPIEKFLNETLDDEEKTPKYIVDDGVAFLNAKWVLNQVEIIEDINKYDLENNIHIEYIRDYDGVHKYEATATVPTIGWILGINIPLPDYSDEVARLISSQFPVMIFAVLISIISIITAAIMIVRIRHQHNLERTVEVAQAASKTKSDFLSRMSHEMRTPMNAIIGMTKIADTTNDIGKLKYCLSTIESSSTHLLGIINDVLDMSKIEAGKLELVNSPLNIEKMLMKICNLIVDKTEQKSQNLDIILGKNMRMLYIGDELRLSQVITNLLSNAVKFTPENGSVTLSVDEVRRNERDAVLRFSVADTGIGMTKEQMGRLFQSFEQADKTISGRFGGTGLGLVISKNIVEKMGGRIWVKSEPEEGTNFSFEVTLKHSGKKNAAVIFDKIRPDDLKVLVVDDDEKAREYLKSITESFGIPTETAESGKKAIYLVDVAKETSKPYDVIFLDYDMPVMNGIETVRNLNAKIDKNTVIIMTSFLTWSKIESEAKNVGVTGFVAKPLFPSAVLDAINEVVGKTVKNLKMKAQASTELPDFSNINLLLAEDMEINREVFIALLENTKVNIETANDGFEVIKKFKDNEDHYDIIIMDIQMPGMDGYEATREIRQLNTPRSQSIPIIAMTANVFKEDVDRCIESGMNDHLSKPINEKEVIEKINSYVRSHEDE